MSSIGDMLSKAKRRGTQLIVNKFGGGGSKDPDYDDAKDKVLAHRALLERIERNYKKYLDVMRQLCLATSEIGKDVAELMGSSDERFRPAAHGFVTAFSNIDESVRRAMDEKMVTEVLDPLKAKVKEMDDIKAKMSLRERYKLDFDSAYRNVKSLKETGSSDPHKLIVKERELEQARGNLIAASRVFYEHSRSLEERRCTMFLPEIRSFLRAQYRFFDTGRSAISTIPDFPALTGPIPNPAYVDPMLNTTIGKGPLYLVDPAAPMGASPPAPRPAPTAPPGAAGFGGGGGYPEPSYGAPGGYPGPSAPAPRGYPHHRAAGAPSLGATGAAMLKSSYASSPRGGASKPTGVKKAPPPLPGTKVTKAPPPPVPALPARGSRAPKPPPKETVTAVFEYTGKHTDELSLNPGDIVTVERKEADGWWYGTTSDGRSGLFPSNFVE